MPYTVTETIFHFREDGTWWTEPGTREMPTYDERVSGRMDELRREHPDGRYPSAYAEHEDGECALDR